MIMATRLRSGLQVAAIMLILGPVTLSAGECVSYDSAYGIIRELADADPDDLPIETKYLLGCLDYGVDKLYRRYLDYPPSWRLLRNTRREYRDLGRNPEVVAAIERITISKDWRLRYAASVALALYGREGYCDTVLSYLDRCRNCRGHVAKVLIFAGDSRGVGLAIAAWETVSREAFKTQLLDALYYQSTPEAIAFIEGVVNGDGDKALRQRARWMLQNPMPASLRQ